MLAESQPANVSESGPQRKQATFKFRWYRTLVTKSKSVHLLFPCSSKEPLELHYIGVESDIDAYESCDVTLSCGAYSSFRLGVDQTEYQLESFDVKHYSFEIHLYIELEDFGDQTFHSNEIDSSATMPFQIPNHVVADVEETGNSTQECGVRGSYDQRQEQVHHITGDKGEYSHPALDDVIVIEDNMLQPVIDETNQPSRLTQLRSSDETHEGVLLSDQQLPVDHQQPPISSDALRTWLDVRLRKVRSSTTALEQSNDSSTPLARQERAPNSGDRESSSSEVRPLLESTSIDCSTPLVVSRSRSVESVVSVGSKVDEGPSFHQLIIKQSQYQRRGEASSASAVVTMPTVSGTVDVGVDVNRTSRQSISTFTSPGVKSFELVNGGRLRTASIGGTSPLVTARTSLLYQQTPRVGMMQSKDVSHADDVAASPKTEEFTRQQQISLSVSHDPASDVQCFDDDKLATFPSHIGGLERHAADRHQTKNYLLTKVTKAEQVITSLTMENESLRVTMGQKIQRLEDENKALRKQLRRMRHEKRSGQSKNPSSLHAEVQELRAELNELRNDNRQLAYNNRQLMQQIALEWKHIGCHDRDVKQTNTESVSITSNPTLTTLISRQNLSQQNVNNWLNGIDNDTQIQQSTSSRNRTLEEKLDEQTTLTNVDELLMQNANIDVTRNRNSIPLGGSQHQSPADDRSVSLRHSSQSAVTVKYEKSHIDKSQRMRDRSVDRRERKLSSVTDILLQENGGVSDWNAGRMQPSDSCTASRVSERCSSTRSSTGERTPTQAVVVTAVATVRSSESPNRQKQKQTVERLNMEQPVVEVWSSSSSTLQSEEEDPAGPLPSSSTCVRSRRMSINSNSTELLLHEADRVLNDISQKRGVAEVTMRVLHQPEVKMSSFEREIDNKRSPQHAEKTLKENIESGSVRSSRRSSRVSNNTNILQHSAPEELTSDLVETEATEAVLGEKNTGVISELSKGSSEHSSTKYMKQPFVPRSASDINIGDVVKFQRQGGKVSKGQVKYVGQLPRKSDVYLGVQLEREWGKHDGVYEGQRVFQCDVNRGVFVAFSKVVMAWHRPNEPLFPR